MRRSNLLAGADPDWISSAVAFVTSATRAWDPPAEYKAATVAETVCRIVTGFRVPDAAEREWDEGART